MEINITSLFSENSPFVPFDCNNNAATLGDNAGELTWQASCQTASEITPLDTPEKLQAMQDFARSSGGWNDEEVAEWSETEVNALLLQWVAGDVRAAFGDTPFPEWDWQQYEEDYHAGRVSSNLFKTDTGEVYFSLDS